MVTQRRIFKAKVGKSTDVVRMIKAFDERYAKAGLKGARVYTDYLSGPTDTVVWEFDAKDLGDLEKKFNGVGQRSADAAFAQKWFKEFQTYLESATVEVWKREA
ncbi:MAG: hypothetical protein HYX97_00325 [Chloroflexi bacterium]|nr:hypothetical protein [Chloroflexota bacterium]